VNSTSFLTLEALVSSVADSTISLTSGLESVTICGSKPDALACAEAAEIKVTRSVSDSVNNGGFSHTAPNGMVFLQYDIDSFMIIYAQDRILLQSRLARTLEIASTISSLPSVYLRHLMICALSIKRART
jgi:hypothetical protein